MHTKKLKKKILCYQKLGSLGANEQHTSVEFEPRTLEYGT